jgi:hypothetical protein
VKRRHWVAALVVVALLVVLAGALVHYRHDSKDTAKGSQVPAATMRVGVHENYQGPDKTTLALTLARFPQIDITREFEAHPLPAQDLVGRINARCGIIWLAEKSCVWSFKPLPADVKSGAWRLYVRELAQYLADTHLENRTVITIWHEPENDVPKWFRSPADFVRVFNTVHDWLISVDGLIETSHAALGYLYSRMTDRQARQWVTRASIQAIDVYSGRSFPLDMTLATSVAFARWKATRPAGSKWAVSERGWIAVPALSAQRSASITAEADWLVSLPLADRPDFYIVWNTPGVENDPTIPLDAAGRAAVNAMFARLVA